MRADSQGLPRNGFRKTGNAKRLLISVLIEPNTQVNEEIIDNSKRLLYFFDLTPI